MSINSSKQDNKSPNKFENSETKSEHEIFPNQKIDTEYILNNQGFDKIAQIIEDQFV